MTRFSRMKFSQKIFLAIFGTASFSALILCLSLYATLSRYQSSDFEDSYVDHMNLFGKALGRIEAAQARIALNAAKAVELRDQDVKGKWTNKDLRALADELGVSEVNVFNQDGKAMAYSDDLPEPLFAEFPDLLTINSLVYQTHLLRDSDSKVRHHTILRTIDLNRYIEAALYFDAVTQLLKEMAEHDVDNLVIEMFGPDSKSLGRIQKEDFTETLDLSKALSLKDGAHWDQGRLIVLASSTNANQKTYRLAAVISDRFLRQGLQKIQMTLAVAALILILISWVLSQALTNTLLAKVESIRSLLSRITQDQDYSKRVSIVEKSKDELDELGGNLNHMLETLQAHQFQLLGAERDKARAQIAAQVAHDIRSPLMSMNMALSQIESPQKESLAIIKSAVARVTGIVQKLSSLSAKSDESAKTEEPKLTLVEPVIATVVNEHRVRKADHQTLKFTGMSATPHLWSVVQVNEIQTALSNMINNSFEAGATEVHLTLSEQPKAWTLEVKDNGKGIPSAIIDKIFERSFTFGKAAGTGLGLFQAKAAIEWSGGTLELQSEEGKGTTFTIRIPREKTPGWLPSLIELANDQIICFVDDDAQILESWKAKAQAASLKQAHFFESIEALEKAFPLSDWPPTALLVIDQNLSETKKGLEVMSALAIGKRAYLCTTDFDEKWIQDQVRKINGFLIPKLLVSQFEIKVRGS